MTPTVSRVVGEGTDGGERRPRAAVVEAAAPRRRDRRGLRRLRRRGPLRRRRGLLPSLDSLEGQLTATVHATDADNEDGRPGRSALELKAGRILFNGWPTGVEVGHAMVHGGPYPATSDSRSTSVGSLAIERFQRPVAYQDVPAALLPEAVRDDNPWHLSPPDRRRAAAAMTTTIAKVEVVPVAGHDSMLLNLSGAHAPFFTRNIAILTDSEGREGVGEVPGGEPIRRTIEEAAELLVGQPVTRYRSLLRQVAERFADRDAGAAGPQTFDLRTTVHAVTALESALLDLAVRSRVCRSPSCSATGSSATRCRCSATSSTSVTPTRPTCPTCVSPTVRTTGSASGARSR